MVKIIKLEINGKPFSYEDAELTRADAKPITIEEGKAVLELTKYLFDTIGLDFFLCFGTLLGAVRDKSIIIGDEDVDTFILNEKLLYENLPWLDKHGLHVIRVNKGKVYSFRSTGNVYIDVYIARPYTGDIWSLYCWKLNSNITPKKYFKQFQEIDFLGKKYKCPKDPHKILEFWYGKTWKTPIRSHNKFLYCVPSAYYWHWKGYYIKKILYSLIGKNIEKTK